MFRDVLQQVRTALHAPATPVSWAIGDLLDHKGIDLMDTAPVIAAINQDRVEYLFANDIYDLPNDQRPVCHQNGRRIKRCTVECIGIALRTPSLRGLGVPVRAAMCIR